MEARDEKPEPTPKKKRNSKKLTLHPRTFEEAVKEIWSAEPPEKDGKKGKASEQVEREQKQQIESGQELP